MGIGGTKTVSGSSSHHSASQGHAAIRTPAPAAVGWFTEELPCQANLSTFNPNVESRPFRNASGYLGTE